MLLVLSMRAERQIVFVVVEIVGSVYEKVKQSSDFTKMGEWLHSVDSTTRLE